MHLKGWQVMTWAWTVDVETPPERSVLVAYAWRAGPKLTAWPGLDQLEHDTKHYRETISAARRALVGYGYMTDTGERRGVNGRVAVYRLNVHVTNQRQKPRIKPVDNSDQSAAKAADSLPAMSGIDRDDQRQKPLCDTPEKPHQNYEVELSMNSSGAQAREQAQGAEAQRHPEQTQRTDAIEPAIEKLKRAHPDLFRKATE